MEVAKMDEYISKQAFKEKYLCCGWLPEMSNKEFDDFPAADVVAVRHGRWIEDERTYPGPGLKNNLCSVCGEIAGSWKEGLEPGRKWAYCPNCGARMGKEDEHEAD